MRVGNAESDWTKHRHAKRRYAWVLIVFIFSSLFPTIQFNEFRCYNAPVIKHFVFALFSIWCRRIKSRKPRIQPWIHSARINYTHSRRLVRLETEFDRGLNSDHELHGLPHVMIFLSSHDTARFLVSLWLVTVLIKRNSAYWGDRNKS